MSCSLDSIVTLGICEDDSPSLSGFQLVQAPGISALTLAATANETYQSGVELAMQKKDLAILQFRNDFIGALQANNVVTTISHPVYTSSLFNTAAPLTTYAGYRGVTMYRSAQYRGNLRKQYIKSIQLYPLNSGTTVLNIQDGYNSYSWDIELVGGQVNTFDEDNLEGLPFVMSTTASALRITVDNTNIAFTSSVITCMKGCDGSLPNPCGWVEGWNGTNKVKDEGYGISIDFYCACDYEQVICDLSKTFSGELIWLKWQIAIFEEQYKTNRFDNIVVYNHEDLLKNIIPDLTNKYNAKWNALMNGVLGILRTYRDDCLDCRGIKTFANI